jgi:hypothetical protein
MRRAPPPRSLAIFLVVLLALGIPGVSLAIPVRSAGAVSALVAAAPPGAPSIPSSFPPGPTGVGNFFANTVLPLPANGTETCTRGPGSAGLCVNVTNEPSLNLTSRGVLAVAYTAMTNQTPCANVSGNASSEIGLSVSHNLGASWSTPSYLGNTDCTVGRQFASAWEPSLTSLSNGTLVLAYIQYNLTYLGPYSYSSFQFGYAPYAYPSNTPSARLVVSDSYDNGSTWTTPVVLNSSVLSPTHLTSWAPERPWIDALGNTVYVVWENATQTSLFPQLYYPTFTSAGSMASHLKVSTDGGRTFGATIDLPVTPGVYQYPYAPEHVGMNPTVSVARNGSVYVAYVTNVSEDAPVCSPTLCLPGPVLAGDIVLGRSSNNGSTFDFTTAARTVALDPLWGPFYDPSPRIAFGPASQVYLAYSGGEVVTYCYPGTFGGCNEGTTPNVFFTNSSNGGVSFPAPHLAWSGFQDPNGGIQNQVYNPAMTVAGGTVYLEASFVNASECAFGQCGVQQQVFLTSLTNGTQFSPPLVISGNYTFQPYEWDGEYDSLVAGGGHVWVAYVQDLCPDWNLSYCNYLFSVSGRAQVTIAEPFGGLGAQLTFHATGLPAGTPWGVDVLGNHRQGTAPSDLVLTGVPFGQVINWTLPWANASDGIAYVPSVSVQPPWVPSGNLVVNVSFTELVRVVVASEPRFDQCYGTGCLNFVFAANPGVYWVAAGSTFSDGLTLSPPSCTGYCDYLNLSFVDWAGVGAGSVSTTSLNFSTTVTAPINETAAFLIDSSCSGTSPTVVCLGNFSYPLEFDAHGLPAGTAWTVSVDGVTNTSTGASMWMDAPNGLANYSVWTVPVGRSTISYWIPTPDLASPVQVPYVRVVDVNFTRSTLTGAIFNLEVGETGLPAGTPWIVHVDGTNTTLTTANATLPEPAGITNAAVLPIVEANGTEYVAALARVIPLVQNLSAGTLGTPVNFDLNGSYALTFQFTPRYLVTASAGLGGTVSPPTTWVPGGNSVTLLATASAGEQFIGWVGVGGGSTGASNPHPSITIYPSTAVTETATFAPLPTVYTVSAQSTGLPPGEPFTIGVGSINMTGAGTLSIGNLAPGWYSWRAPGLVDPVRNGTRYQPGAVTGVPLASNGSFDLTTNLSLSVPFTTEFSVSVEATSGGTVSSGTATPLVGGSAWVAEGTSINLTADPLGGQVFLGWIGNGSGSVTQPNASILVQPMGAVTELAEFGPSPPPSNSTYAISVLETGLPNGTRWGVEVGNESATGTTPTLMLPALPNGSYLFTVPTIAPIPGEQFSPTLVLPCIVAGTAVHRTVQFSLWVAVTVASAGPGTVVPNGSFYWPAGTALMLHAQSSVGAAFVSWNGSGPSSTSGTSAQTSVTPSAPIIEVAQFAAAASTSSTTTVSPNGMSTASGLEVGLGLFVILAAAGVLLGRRGASSRPIEPAEPTSPGSVEEEGSIYSASTPRPPEAGAPEWSEDVPPDWSEDPPGSP